MIHLLISNIIYIIFHGKYLDVDLSPSPPLLTCYIHVVTNCFVGRIWWVHWRGQLVGPRLSAHFLSTSQLVWWLVWHLVAHKGLRDLTRLLKSKASNFVFFHLSVTACQRSPSLAGLCPLVGCRSEPALISTCTLAPPMEEQIGHQCLLILEWVNENSACFRLWV